MFNALFSNSSNISSENVWQAELRVTDSNETSTLYQSWQDVSESNDQSMLDPG
jgi:hypothetical protein